MFTELGELLDNRAITFLVSSLGGGQIQVHVVPVKLKDDTNDALTTPLSVTGTAAELDAELPAAIRDYVESHKSFRSTLEDAKQTLADAAKTEKEAAAAKQKDANKKKAEATGKPEKPEPPATGLLFGEPVPDAKAKVKPTKAAPAAEPETEEEEGESEDGD